MSAHILLIAEIAQVVLEHLDPGPLLDDEPTHSVAVKERGERRHALAQLATVCHDVSWIALDVLWRHIDAVHHLLFALRPYNHRQQMFTDSIEDEDWARFQEYAQRVRGLYLGDVKPLDAAVWVVLTQRCARGPLLPRLENLSRLRMDKSSPCYTMFLSPSLKGLGLTVCKANGEERSIIQMVVRMIQPFLRSVQHLVLDDLSYNNSPIPFWELTQLHTLQVDSEGRQGCALRMQELACLGSFQHLRKLQMRLASISALEELTATAMGFHSLRELKLAGRLGDICAFIVAAAPPSLEVLSIHAHSLCSREDVEDGPHLQSVLPNGVRSFAPIHAKLTPSLRRFEVNLRCDCYGARHFPDSDALLGPLRAAPNLRSISFVFKGTRPHLGNGTLPALQDEWPELVEFEFSEFQPADWRSHSQYRSRSRSYSPPQRYGVDNNVFSQASSSAVELPSVQALGVFAHAHPHLTRLTVLSMDLRAVPDIAVIPLLDHGLQHLSFSTLQADVGLFPFALALDMLFPRLDVSGATNLTPNARYRMNRNAELQLLLLALQTGRRIGTAGRADLGEPSISKLLAGFDPPAIQVLQRPRRTLFARTPRQAHPVPFRGRGSPRSPSHSRSPSPDIPDDVSD